MFDYQWNAYQQEHYLRLPSLWGNNWVSESMFKSISAEDASAVYTLSPAAIRDLQSQPWSVWDVDNTQPQAQEFHDIYVAPAMNPPSSFPGDAQVSLGNFDLSNMFNFDFGNMFNFDFDLGGLFPKPLDMEISMRQMFSGFNFDFDFGNLFNFNLNLSGATSTDPTPGQYTPGHQYGPTASWDDWMAHLAQGQHLGVV